MRDPSDSRPRAVGRPALSPEQIDARIDAYCHRYGVAAAGSGLPPFPSGRRETKQHREWLALYRARQRSERRAAHPAVGVASSASPGSTKDPGLCPVCAERLPAKAASFEAHGGRTLRLHRRCAELARQAGTAGADAVRRVLCLLWPE